ncbi:MAG TPA: glycoside hydrolase family 36 protein [Vicinamibacterales bacterium]
MFHRPAVIVSLAFWLFSTLLTTAPVAAATTVASAGDATITHDESSGTWTLSASGTRLTLTLDAGRDFGIARLVTPSGTSWIRSAISDSIIKVGTSTVALGARASGFQLQGVSLDTQGDRLQLNATFELAPAGLRVTRHYRITAGAPAFEAWNTYTPMQGTPTIADLNALQIVVDAGTVRTLTGLKGDNADVEGTGVFTLQQKTVSSSQTIGSSGRASEAWVPWLAVDSGKDEFYVALMWSGAWSMTATRTSNALSLAAGLAPMTTTLRSAVDGPHVVFGAVTGGAASASAALRSYIVNGLRTGRGLSPLVTYNTWFAYGTSIDEPSMMAEMDAAAALGAELFVIDAGWYPGAGAGGPFDFDAGLGGWTPDPARFPNGLRPLRDHAHAIGLKFGLWVEPERVNLSLVGSSGIEDDWLVKNNGDYGSDHAALICLSNKAARDWILSWLTPLLDQVQPDYLKWDNNMWVNCTREGHEHGSSDGNFAQVNGLYDVLQSVRDQYRDLLIENVSGGGNRLDVGMLRYSDVAWMDDRTAPSAHVRHNIEGLSAVFPPAYLLSFVTDHATEPLHEAPDISLYVRSRMGGVLGLCFRSVEFVDADAASIFHEIDVYKGLRDVIGNASALLLTTQAGTDNGPAWDVLETTDDSDADAVISAFQTDDGVKSINVKPVGLGPGTTYSVRSVDTGLVGEFSGADLMSTGIDIVQSPNSAAHILTLRAKQ